MRQKKIRAGLLLFILLCPVLLKSAEKISVISFQGGLKKLLKKNARLLQSKANLLTFEAYQDEADAAIIPEVSVLSFIAPTFSVKGDALNVERDYSKWGPALVFQTQIIWPFYSFGKLSLAKKAARQGLSAYQSLHKSEINRNIYEYKKLYLSLILLKQFKEVLEEAGTRANEILEEAQKSYAAGEGKILRKDISRLKIYHLEIQKLKEEHWASQNSARLAIAHFLGERKFYEAQDDEFPDIGDGKLALHQLIDLTFRENPDIKGLKLGIQASRNLLKFEKKGLLPVFFIGAQGAANYTKLREDQDSSFAYDPYNQLSAAIAAGVNWKLNWGKYKSGIKKAQAEYEKILAQKKEADTGYPLEVSIAFWTMQKNQKVWRLSQKKLKEAKRWSVAEFTSYSSGVGSAKDLVEALAAFYLTKREVIEAEYNYLLSWAKLAFKVGESSMVRKF